MLWPRSGCGVFTNALKAGRRLNRSIAIKATVIDMRLNISFPLSFNQPAAHPLENPMWSAVGLRQSAVVSRHPQMMPTIGRP